MRSPNHQHGPPPKTPPPISEVLSLVGDGLVVTADVTVSTSPLVPHVLTDVLLLVSPEYEAFQ